MKIGKLSNEQLTELVLARLPKTGGDVLCGPGIGLDCAAVRLNEGVIVLSSDPITGAAKDIGRLAIHISCNDIAAAGIRPLALMLVLIAPPTATAAEVARIMDDASAAAESLSVSIVGGHTEISDAVSRYLIVTTAIGFTQGRPPIDARSAKPGDTLIMTKTAGLEGTSILASDQSNRFASHLSPEEIVEAAALIDQISVVREGLICAELGVHAMHDATEGGLLGAIHELCDACACGCRIDADAMPVHPLTRRITTALDLDPYRLLSSGSLLIATPSPDIVLQALSEAGIRATAIGLLTSDPGRRMTLGGLEMEILPPMPDELYKIV